jgi:hypothetical protein
VRRELGLQNSDDFNDVEEPLFVHVLGCGHTGSSIFARILGEHSKIYFVPIESGMFLANRFFEEDIYRDKYISEALKCEASFVLEKTPRHIWHHDYIRRKYPNTKFIITTRDGREVIGSLYERYRDWRQAFSRYLDDSIMSLRQLTASDTMLVKYENFVSDPSAILERTYNWIGLSFEKTVLEYYERPFDWNMTNPYMTDGLPTDHDSIRNLQVNSKLDYQPSKWRSRVPEELHSEMEALFAPGGDGNKIMKAFGYEI